MFSWLLKKFVVHADPDDSHLPAPLRQLKTAFASNQSLRDTEILTLALCGACLRRDLIAAEYLARYHHAPVDGTSFMWHAPLFAAIDAKDEGMVRLLLKYRANPKPFDLDMHPPDPAIVGILAHANPDCPAPDSDDIPKEVQDRHACLEANPELRESYIRTLALCGAAALNRLTHAEYLLGCENAPADGVADLAHAPLFAAIDADNVDILHLLDKFGVKRDVDDLDKYMPRSDAMRKALYPPVMPVAEMIRKL